MEGWRLWEGRKSEGLRRMVHPGASEGPSGVSCDVEVKAEDSPIRIIASSDNQVLRCRVVFLQGLGRFVQNLLGWAAPVFAKDVQCKATSAVADTGAAELGQDTLSVSALNISFEAKLRKITLIKLNSYLQYSILVDVC